MIKPRNTHYSKVTHVEVKRAGITITRWYAGPNWNTQIRSYPMTPARAARLSFDRIRRVMKAA